MKTRASHALLLGALASACGPVTSGRRAAQPVPIAPPPRPMEELARQLDAADAPSRVAAAWALAGATDVPAPVLERLMFRYLNDESDPVREAAAWTLAHLPGPHRDQLYETAPRLLVQTKPFYPEHAFQQKIEGTVDVALLIDALGRVAHAEIRGSIPELDTAALRTVKEWQFAPATKNGRAVPCMAMSPVTFRIY